MIKLTHKYRPKADRQLLHDLINDAWQTYHDEQFPESKQTVIGEQLAALLEQRFPPADMAVLAKYGQARAVEEVSINIYDPDHERWDCYASHKLPRPVLCPQGRAHFFVGGYATDREDRLPAEFESYFNKILTARKAWQAESRFIPQRNGASYPTWEQIAAQLAVAGNHIRAAAPQAVKEAK